MGTGRAHAYRADEAQCAICERPVRCMGEQSQEGDYPYLAIVIDGGAAWGDQDSDASAPGYMGEFPVGADCHRRFVERGPVRDPQK